ncbi:MAG TPA: hypothetical protein VGQ08_02505 [Nitrospiraceae bacterium]|jgi:hypothetical protein|nr:hypothetical protein [Nitrospiraceae bacterium]
MTNKPSLWMLAAETFALLAVVAYSIFALPLADHMKSDLVPPDKTGLPRPSNIVETKMAFLCLHSFSWTQDPLSLKRVSSSGSDSQA